MGKNISIYLDDDLLDLLKSFNLPPSKIIQNALRSYYVKENRKKSFYSVVKIAKEIGNKEKFLAVINDWQEDRKLDRW